MRKIYWRLLFYTFYPSSLTSFICSAKNLCISSFFCSSSWYLETKSWLSIPARAYSAASVPVVNPVDPLNRVKKLFLFRKARKIVPIGNIRQRERLKFRALLLRGASKWRAKKRKSCGRGPWFGAAGYEGGFKDAFGFLEDR